MAGICLNAGRNEKQNYEYSEDSNLLQFLINIDYHLPYCCVVINLNLICCKTCQIFNGWDNRARNFHISVILIACNIQVFFFIYVCERDTF